MAVAKDSLDLLQGTLDMLVLKALSREQRHGYAIMRWIRQVSGDEFQIEEGALYPALHRMEGRGWIEAEWGRSENNRQAKFYRLTPKGQHQRDVQENTWGRYVRAVGRVLEAAANLEST